MALVLLSSGMTMSLTGRVVIVVFGQCCLKQYNAHDENTHTQNLLEGGSGLDGLGARGWHALVAEVTLVAVLGEQAHIAHLHDH